MKIENKMTAVQWLLNEWQSLETTLPQSLIVKVLEMEKQQITDAVDYGKNHSYDYSYNYSEDNEVDYYSAEQYYNDTFNNED